MKIKTCRICLVMEVKMFNLGNTEVKKFIESVFNLYGFNQNLNALHYICYECRAYLEKTFQFIQRVLKAQKVLYDMLKEKKKICQPDLQNLDRNKLGLNSNLRKLECIIDLDCRSNIKTNSVDNCMHLSKEGGVEIKGETTFTGLVIKDTDKFYEKKCDVDIENEIHPNQFLSTYVNKIAMRNNHQLNKLHTTVNRSDTRQSCTVHTIDTQKQSNIVHLKKEEDEPSIFANMIIPKTEIISNLDESQNVDIKTEKPPHPLESICATNISLESKICNNLPSETNSLIWPEQSSSTVKSFAAETNCEVFLIKQENRDEDDSLSNAEIKLDTSNKEDEWRFVDQPKKQKYLECQSTHENGKLNLEVRIIASTASVEKSVENDILETTRTKAEYVLGDNFNSSVEEMNKKGIKKQNDDNYHPSACIEEPTNSMIDRHNNEVRHLKKSDKLVYPRKCDHCNFEVPLRKEHYIHYLRFHRDIIVEYPYTQAEKKSYVCKFCGKLSKVLKNHKIHELGHGEKTVKCVECPKKFTCTATMKAHLRCVHSGKIYECDYCGKTSKTRSDCILHTRIHTGEKPYKCHICGIAFAHGGNRIAHIRTVHAVHQVTEKQKT